MMRALATGLVLVLAGAATAVRAQGPVAPYQDRVIEGLPALGAVDSDSEFAPYDEDGWARYLRFETRLGTDPFNNNRTAAGVALFGLVETPNHGVVSVDLSATGGAARPAWTLRQRGLPVNGGWRVNNEAGVVGTPTPSITRLPSRVYVPGSLIEGVATDWSHAGQGINLQASAGRPGRLEGAPSSGFRGLSGRISALGAQVDAAPWQMAARVAQSSGISLLDTPALPGDLFDANSTQLSVRRERDGMGMQGNLVSTRASNLDGQRNGFWLDGEWSDGQRQHTAGIYRLERDLSWAGQPLASDAQGVYARTNWRTRQWSADGGVDWLRTVDGAGTSGVFATGNLRWRYSRSVSFGGGASVRRFRGNAWSGFGDVRWLTGLGSSSLRVDLSNDLDRTRAQTLTFDQEWNAPTGWLVSTSVLAGSEATALERYSRWAVAAAVGAPLGANVLLRGNINAERTTLGDARSGANLSLNWRLNPRWSLEGSYNLVRGQGRSLVSIDPLAPPVLGQIVPTNSRSLLVILRWEDRAGTRGAPLGGRPEDGGGRVEGVVFLDTNRNGLQEAGEGGAQGATVLLDGLYTAKTDAQGRFEFPFVASGERTLTVLNETLPLPWIAPGEARTRLTVRLRESVLLAIPVTRQGQD